MNIINICGPAELIMFEFQWINEMIIKSRHVNIGYHAVGGEPTIPSLPV